MLFQKSLEGRSWGIPRLAKDARHGAPYVTFSSLYGRLTGALADGGTGQVVGFSVVGSGDVGYREIEGARQFATGPVERVEARAAADVLATHLADDDFGIGIDVEGFRLLSDGELQGFHEGDILGYIVILMADPFGDADGAAFAAVDDHSNTRWPWIAQGTTIHIGHEF
jgi:hypothetical protein